MLAMYIFRTSHTFVQLKRSAILLNKLDPSQYLLIQSQQWNTTTLCEISSKLAIKTTDRRRRSGLFDVNLEQISHTVLIFPFLTLNK